LLIDTSIDKSSSAELSEAINSMFSWYQKSKVCYAYLNDVDSHHAFGMAYNHDMCVAKLGRSRWFTRGWTLQELLAPDRVCFFARDWRPIGTKLHLYLAIEEITSISSEALLGRPLSSFNVAERMSWASKRETTREEDMAYSLLGIFNIHMPLLYGEGTQAFRRLQEQIIENILDYTIFAWNISEFEFDWAPKLALLAKRPSAFRRDLTISSKYLAYSSLMHGLLNIELSNVVIEPPAVTSQGIRLHRPMVREDDGTALICLCWLHGREDEILCLKLHQTYPSSSVFHRSESALVVKHKTELRVMPMTFFYGAREDSPPNSDEHPNQAALLLNLVVNDMLPVVAPDVGLFDFAFSLKHDTAWCSECGYHALQDLGLMIRMSHHNVESPNYTKHVQEHQERCTKQPRDERPAITLPLSATGTSASQETQNFVHQGYRWQAFRLQWHLHNLRVRDHVDWVPYRTLYFCCLIALIHERRARRLTSQQQMLFLRGLVHSTSPVESLGTVVGNVLETCTECGQRSWLFASIVRCCGILAEEEEVDSLIMYMLKKHACNPFSGEDLQQLAHINACRPRNGVLDAIAGFRYEEILINAFVSRLTSQPSPGNASAFGAWLWSLFTTWLSYAEPWHLYYIFLALFRKAEHLLRRVSLNAFGRIVGEENDPAIENASSVIRILVYCAKRLADRAVGDLSGECPDPSFDEQMSPEVKNILDGELQNRLLQDATSDLLINTQRA
jgi:hypothetical protein